MVNKGHLKVELFAYRQYLNFNLLTAESLPSNFMQIEEDGSLEKEKKKK